MSSLPRRISNAELCDLSEDWHNATVDTSKYYQCVLMAWEVTKELCDELRRDGVLWQEVDGRYYVA